MKTPKGKLMVIGGRELYGDNYGSRTAGDDEFLELEILRRILAELDNPSHKIEVITTASAENPKDLGKSYHDAFAKLGFKKTGVLDIRVREDAFDQKYVDRISKSGAVILSGGDQLRLSTILGGTPVLDHMFRRYETENFLIAGTSAGAMVMSNAMIFQGRSEESFYKGGLKITSGFGLFPGVIIDTHFIRRGRFGRLAQAVAINPGYLGIGLEEDTAVLVTRGDQLEVVGTGNVIIIDGHTIKGSNFIDVEEGAPLSIDSLTVHIMAKGDKFSISDKQFIRKENGVKQEKHKSK